MPDTFATDEPPTTDPTAVRGIMGDTTEVWAYAGVVVIETYQGRHEADNHLSLPAARALVQNLNAAIIAASLLASAEP